ncbi:tRNA (adenosine(37)-N6)-threonylcarbamoyltransferase complex ATPase subunit type 1 TsaE [Arcobacter sp. LA11]|uniref:tRNA (adenosine(37)-N6)-threonylcarbamoyltransferase complex ATPase subunit type 1 TsaE n=1 Tax=Arcobacter sp. LA11 TaxID=1898176 RepID=UPI000933983B|nr:tRNA (adenosine(37)-N6)-threonylcarbamoyltransferase complex ATPase subunit type 1 TsaE [Arcobacter sp. LA11]
MKSFILGIDSINQIIDELKLKLEILENSCIVILRGDLASGKTTLVKEYVKSLGLDDLVTSPTFSLQSIYSNEIYHYDVYNKTLEEFISFGMIEEFEKNGIHFVEWGDERLEALLKSYGYDVILLEIKKENDKRQYILNE